MARQRTNPVSRVAALCLAAVLVAACSPRQRYGAATTTVVPTGSCDTSRVVAVGATLPLSGPERALGHEYLTGLEMGVEHVNRTGGISQHHRCLELVYKDDRGRDRVADRAVLDLLHRETVSFLIAPSLAAQVRATGADLARAGIPTGSFSGLDATFRRRRYPWLFPVSPSGATVAARMASFAHSRGWARVGVVATDDPAGHESARAFIRSARRRHIEIAGSVVLGQQTETTRVVRRLRDMHATGLVLAGDSPALARALLARAQLRWAVPVVAGAVVADEGVVGSVGTARLGRVFTVVPQPFVVQHGASSSTVRGFRDRVRHRLHRSHLEGSVIPFAQAYDAVSMLASTAKSIDSTSPASVRTFLESAGYLGLLATYSYTAQAHAGIPGDQLAVVPLTTLTDGLFRAP